MTEERKHIKDNQGTEKEVGPLSYKTLTDKIDILDSQLKTAANNAEKQLKMKDRELDKARKAITNGLKGQLRQNLLRLRADKFPKIKTTIKDLDPDRRMKKEAQMLADLEEEIVLVMAEDLAKYKLYQWYFDYLADRKRNLLSNKTRDLEELFSNANEAGDYNKQLEAFTAAKEKQGLKWLNPTLLNAVKGAYQPYLNNAGTSIETKTLRAVNTVVEKMEACSKFGTKPHEAMYFEKTYQLYALIPEFVKRVIPLVADMHLLDEKFYEQWHGNAKEHFDELAVAMRAKKNAKKNGNNNQEESDKEDGSGKEDSKPAKEDPKPAEDDSEMEEASQNKNGENQEEKKEETDTSVMSPQMPQLQGSHSPAADLSFIRGPPGADEYYEASQLFSPGDGTSRSLFFASKGLTPEKVAATSELIVEPMQFTPAAESTKSTPPSRGKLLTKAALDAAMESAEKSGGNKPEGASASSDDDDDDDDDEDDDDDDDDDDEEGRGEDDKKEENQADDG